MKYFIISFAMLATLLYISGCDVLLDKDLKKGKINVLAPGDSAVLSSTGVTFWWDSLSGAANYSIQIVSPSFTDIQYLVVDTMIIGNKFFYSFQPGKYQWRIKAFNNSSSSDFVLRSFTIDSSLNLGNEVVQLVSPSNQYVTNQFLIHFQWSPVFYANDYRFEILGPSGNTIYVDAALKSDTFSYTFPNDGRYSWRVRAQNNTSISPFSSYSFLIDATPPTAPTFLSPANNATVTNPFTLSWVQTPDNGSIIYDSLYLYLDANQDSAIKAVRPLINSYSDSLEARTYYWKLRAVDSVGNSSEYTSLYKFVLR